MKYIEPTNSLQYFNSIPAYAKSIAETNMHDQLTGFYNIKFCCNINLGRAVYSDLIRIRPYLKDKIFFHVNIEGTKVIFGGRYRVESNVANAFYNLLAKYKETYGKSKPKKIKELA
jgi:hypothetical protein